MQITHRPDCHVAKHAHNIIIMLLIISINTVQDEPGFDVTRFTARQDVNSGFPRSDTF